MARTIDPREFEADFRGHKGDHGMVDRPAVKRNAAAQTLCFRVLDPLNVPYAVSPLHQWITVTSPVPWLGLLLRYARDTRAPLIPIHRRLDGAERGDELAFAWRTAEGSVRLRVADDGARILDRLGAAAIKRNETGMLVWDARVRVEPSAIAEAFAALDPTVQEQPEEETESADLAAVAA